MEAVDVLDNRIIQDYFFRYVRFATKKPVTEASQKSCCGGQSKKLLRRAARKAVTESSQKAVTEASLKSC